MPKQSNPAPSKAPRPLNTLLVSLSLFLTIAALGIALVMERPIYLGLVFGYALFMGLALYAGYDIHRLMNAALQSVHKVRKVLMMLALVGLIIPLWMQTGVLATLMAYSIDAFSGFNLAVAAFLSSVIISMILGSGIGTTSTVGLVFIAIARSAGLNEALIVGAVVSGAYFGDRTSPVSSNFNLVAEITGTDLRQNLVYMLSSTLPVFIMTTTFYAFAGAGATETQLESLGSLRILLDQNFNIAFMQLVPPAIMLFFVLVLRQNMVISLAAAFILSIGSGLMGSGFEWMPLITGLNPSGALGGLLSGGGLISMMNALLIILISAMLNGVFEITRCLEPLLDRVSRNLTTLGRLIFSTGLISLLVSLVSGNQTMTTLITGTYYKDRYDALDVDRQVLARTICDTGVVSVPLIPWNINGILVATVTGVSTVSYLPYALNSWLPTLMTLFFVWRGMKVKTGKHMAAPALFR
jgi:NhaC family Na+:H+ antiporter